MSANRGGCTVKTKQDSHIPLVGGKMLLAEYAESYVTRVGGSPSYRLQVRSIARRINCAVGDLTPEVVDAYLTRALNKLAPTTVSFHRDVLRTLQRSAFNDGLLNASTVPRAFRKVKRPEPNPRAWTHDEIVRLLAVAAEMPGRTRGVLLREIMPAWILVAYSSGLRLGDMLLLRHDAIRGHRLSIVLAKTRRPHVVALDDHAVAAIASLPRCGPRVFGGLISRRKVLSSIRDIVKRAGLDGTGKFLRRSSATYAELAGMDASRQLGHVTPTMKRYYLDRLLLAEHQKAVPSIPLLQSQST